jgi:hypothetical protein
MRRRSTAASAGACTALAVRVARAGHPEVALSVLRDLLAAVRPYAAEELNGLQPYELVPQRGGEGSGSAASGAGLSAVLEADKSVELGPAQGGAFGSAPLEAVLDHHT